ncbi:MAG: ADP-ribosylglycohydrolase family protein [Deltaproteobacteria bacterium]|nr:ADP-ribosylglycohydrolase family protein [Deltaproteobacteria bacterium]
MVGAVLGDVAGSIYEGRRLRTKTKPDFLIDERCHFTDDAVMTCAVAEALMDLDEVVQGGDPVADPRLQAEISKAVAVSLKSWGRLYPHAGYGGGFKNWLRGDSTAPYGSWGNGAAMRVSFVGWAARTLEEAVVLGRLTSAVTHDHPSALRAAAVTAGSIFALRQGGGPAEVERLAREAGYDLSFALDEIRPDYRFDVTCDGSVPQAIKCFLEARDFEDALKLAISLGGDSDTMAAVAGSLAEVVHPAPEALLERAWAKLDGKIIALLDRADDFLKRKGR